MVTDRAVVGAAMPEVREALALGTLSAGHADAIARAANRLDDQERTELATRAPELVEQAAAMSVDTFGRKVRDLARRISRDDGLRHHERLRSQRTVRRWMDREGTCHTQISLDPEIDARLSAVFDAAVAAEKAKPDDGRTSDQVRADAFMAMAMVTVTPGARRPAEPLPPDVVRRLACDADIIPVVLGGDGQVVDVGRARTPRHRRPTTSTPSAAPHLRSAGLPGALR